MKKQTLVLALALLANAFPLFAQKAPFRFGDVSIEELTMASCSFYPEASAMILGEMGEIYFRYDDEKGWQYTLEVTVRKKVFRQAGRDEANITLRLYEPVNSNNREKLEEISGFTYNRVDGKTTKEKLKNTDKYETRINDYLKELTFTFPGIQDGSVIEYQYKIVSDFLGNLQTWHFQHDIPTKFSQLYYAIPERFNYQINQLGYVISLQDKPERIMQTYRYKWERNVPGTIGQSGDDKIDTYCNARLLTAENVPPLEEEPYQANRVDLPSRLEFQLVSYEVPGQVAQSFAGNYETFNRELLKHDFFGKKLSQGKFAEQLVNPSGKSQLETASELLSSLQNHFAWNGINNYWGSNAGAKVFREKTGTSGDINLSLVAAFREYGLEAYPVVLNTRGNGAVHPVYPNYRGFNYVLALVVIDGKSYFADAASSLPLGALPFRCLNDKGWLVSEDGGRWVDLKPAGQSGSIASIHLSPGKGEWTGSIQFFEKGYPAYDSQNRYREKGEDEFLKNLSQDMDEWTAVHLQFEGMNAKGGVKYAVDIKKEIVDEDIIYLSPMLAGALVENPFTRPSRNTSVEFPYAFTKKVTFKLDIPEGYALEFPPSEKVTLFEDAAVFSYHSVYDPVTRILSIVQDFSLKETIFTPDQYEFLREFYSRMEQKNNEPIVLRHE